MTTPWHGRPICALDEGMIPATWLPHRREGDGELVGYLIPQGAASEDGEVVPVTVFGYPLGGAQEQDSATKVLDAVGLSYLAHKWSLRLEDSRWITVWLNEVTPERMVVANADYGYEGDIGQRFVLDLPVDDQLVLLS